ncbi:hypothetical protein GCM10027258_80840 [Amycolatopsis stemonae]
MSVIASVPETISDLTALVEAGNIPAARKLGKKLLNVAETRELWLIARIADLLENRPRTAVDILRQWWASAPSEGDRAIIAACAPKNGEQRRRPQADTGRAPRWNGRNKYQAPSTVKTEQRAELRRRRRSRQEQADAAEFAKYQAERAGVADGEQLRDRDDAARAEQVYASGFDYDRAALYGTGGTRCVGCWISRGPGEVNAERIEEGRNDDGLCVECRESGVAGIPALPAVHSRRSAVYARCDFIAAQLMTTDAVMRAMRREWREAADPAVRGMIADYATAHQFYADAFDRLAGPVDVPELADCGTCGEQRKPRDVRWLSADDGLCTECRAETAAA